MLKTRFELSLEGIKYAADSMINEFDFTSSAIGVGAITITKDGFVVLIRRALWTGEAAGKIDRPGGHPEPDEALKVSLKIFRNVRSYRE